MRFTTYRIVRVGDDWLYTIYKIIYELYFVK